MQEVITVTGGTGTIGGELVRLLSAAGAPTRAVFRDERRTHDLPGVVWLRADLRDPRVLVPALAGTRRLFLLSGNQSGFGRMQIEVVRAARDLGVEHVVKLSALGASDHSRSSIAREHWEVEQVLQQSPMTWTILRPHAFMQNWLGDVAESIRLEGVIRSPIGDARVPFIDTRDIAAVAAETLLHPEAHAGRRYFLTGGEAVGYADVAAAISRATGQPVAYRPISMEEARAEMEARGVPHDLIDAMLAIYTYQKAGGPTSQVSDGVRRVLGRPPRSVADFARDHASHFRPARDTAAHANPSDDQLRAILASARTIAVGRRLLQAGPALELGHAHPARCRLPRHPGNPRETEVLGQRAYSSLDAVPEAVDIVDVFRRPEHAPAIAEETVRKRAGTLWLQLGITNQEAAARAAAGGLTVVMDRCTGEMVERFGIRSAAPVPSDAPAKG